MHTILIDFEEHTTIRSWEIVNDRVMGGKSSSDLTWHPNGYAIFRGQISLENNGGFASIKSKAVRQNVTFNGIKMEIKGDGKTYQLRLKSESDQDHSYVFSFPTSGEWQTIEVPLSSFTPQYRGNQLNLPSFHFDTIQEIGFLLAHDAEVDFELRIRKVAGINLNF